jgi:hypothetical protein
LTAIRTKQKESTMLPETTLTELNRMTPEQRAAFAAGVVGRVFDLYRDTAKPQKPAMRSAIAKTWQRAAGTSLDPDECYDLLNELEEESDDYMDDDDTDIPYGAIQSVIAALNSALDDDADAALDAANEANAEVDRADAASNAQGGLAEEEAWQLEWLRYCASGDPTRAEEEWKQRNRVRPKWYERWAS